MHLLITILQDVCEHELVCNTPCNDCLSSGPETYNKCCTLCYMSFDFDINHCIYKTRYIYRTEGTPCLII